MNKPLHKDPSFWIVAVVVLGSASLVQIYYGIPWYAERIAAMQPAPRVEPLPTQIRTMTSFVQPTNPPHASSEWQLPFHEPGILETAPPQVTILPSKFASPEPRAPGEPFQGGWSMSSREKAIGIRVTPEIILQVAYRSMGPGRTRLVWPEGLSRSGGRNGQPPEYYDFIANLPTGALDALKEEIKKKLGLVAERQMIETNVFVLKVHHSDAPGLKPTTGPFTPQPGQPGMIRLRTITSMMSFLESRLRTPVLDQTGLTGMFDIQLPTSLIRPTFPGAPGGNSENFDQLKKLLLEQYGLELSETTSPVEFLVVNRVN